MLIARSLFTRVALFAAPLAAAMLVAGCSSSGGNTDNGLSPGEASTQPSASAPAPATAAQPADPTAAKADITTAWEAFFSANTPIDQRARYVEGGTQLAQAISAFATMPQTAQASAQVKDITFTSATQANVTYALLLNGQPMLPSASGVAVKGSDGWKVSKNTFCALLGLTGQPVPGCTASAAPGA